MFRSSSTKHESGRAVTGKVMRKVMRDKKRLTNPSQANILVTDFNLIHQTDEAEVKAIRALTENPGG